MKITAGFSLESLGHWCQGQQKRDLGAELVFWGEIEREFQLPSEAVLVIVGIWKTS